MPDSTDIILGEPALRAGGEIGSEPYDCVVLRAHHDGTSYLASRRRALIRIQDVRDTKPDWQERLPRLLVYSTPKAIVAWRAYEEATGPALEAYWKRAAPEAYDEALAVAWKAYEELEANARKTLALALKDEPYETGLDLLPLASNQGDQSP